LFRRTARGVGAAGLDDELKIVEGVAHRVQKLVIRGCEAASDAALVDLERQDAGFGRHECVGNGGDAGSVEDDLFRSERFDEVVMAIGLGHVDLG
jgi:hypothetical protein